MYTLFPFCAISSTRTEGASQWVGSLNKLEMTQIREILYSRVLRQQLYFDQYTPESNTLSSKGSPYTPVCLTHTFLLYIM